jgi:beta-N-acetylhexosaminidase
LTTAAAVIFGCEGLALNAEERALYRDVRPLGFILFARNCETPAQVRALTGEMRELMGDPTPLILIDQEGGRVTRLGPPHWRRPPAGAVLDGVAGRDLAGAARAAYLNARLIAADLASLGITVDCYPPLDLRVPGASTVIGDRSLGADPAQVACLGRAACEGLLDGGVLPVLKHMPGHGRAMADSHVTMPVVRASRDELEASDFAPFRALNDMPIGMTAHVRFDAIDPTRPATTSPRVVSEIIRGSIGFDGLLLSDDLSMAALEGNRATRAKATLAAGCDVVLHCNGSLAEMREIAAVIAPLSADSAQRVARARARLRRPSSIDIEVTQRELTRLIDRRATA